MHMADALLSPPVGATLWAAAGATTVYCARRLRIEDDPARIPLMGVSGAFVFAAQMLNFTIPATGSSGHLGGGLLLAIMLGPEAAFIVMASVLTVQALLFADGGLLALGANVVNLGLLTAFVGYPLVYRPIVRGSRAASRTVLGSVAAAVIGLQLGSLGVVLETAMSGVSDLPFVAFLALMQPIHLAIGLVEGLVTAAVVLFVSKAQPELLDAGVARRGTTRSLRWVLVGLAVSAVVVAGVATRFASTQADGLEWSIARLTGGAELEADGALYAGLAQAQELTALFPGYEARVDVGPADKGSQGATSHQTNPGALVGSAVVLVASIGAGVLVRRRALRRSMPSKSR